MGGKKATAQRVVRTKKIEGPSNMPQILSVHPPRLKIGERKPILEKKTGPSLTIKPMNEQDQKESWSQHLRGEKQMIVPLIIIGKSKKFNKKTDRAFGGRREPEDGKRKTFRATDAFLSDATAAYEEEIKAPTGGIIKGNRRPMSSPAA